MRARGCLGGANGGLDGWMNEGRCEISGTEGDWSGRGMPGEGNVMGTWCNILEVLDARLTCDVV